MTTRANRLRKFGVLVAWLAVAAVATFAGSLAVGAIGSGILPQAERPLSPEEVHQRLAQVTSTEPPTLPGSSVAPTTSPPPSAPAPTPNEVFASRGGTVIARCVPGVQIVSATPAQGYQLKDVEPEDGGQRVRFETSRGSGHNDRVEVQVNCTAGHPVATTR